MIRENKLKYIISLIVILLPSAVALFIKGTLENAMRGAWYFTWLMPVIMAVLHTFMLIITRYIDPVRQSKKIENIIFFIVPAISLYVGGIFISIILGLEFNVGIVCSLLLGIMFIVMGNYLPKAKRNRTFGIKIKWTLANDDNWAATHRLSGKLFVVAGVLSLLMAFLPLTAMFISFTVLLAAIVIIPIVYSYTFYKKQIQTGAATEEDYKYEPAGGKKSTAAVVISIVATALIVCVLMTAGGLKFAFTDDALTVDPTFGGGLELKYSELKDAKIEYRESKVPGTRVMGYGSLKLLYGQFNNDEFGNYTRYTYTKGEASVIIYTDGGVIVIADETAEATLALYDELCLRIANAN